jgi:hypothetical protein
MSQTLPKARKLITLRDAALCITKLPKAEDDADEWRAAMQALLLVAERNGPTMLARIGMSALQSQSNLKQLSRSFCAMATFVRVTREPSGDFIFVNMVAFRCLASGCRRLRLWPDGG